MRMIVLAAAVALLAPAAALADPPAPAIMSAGAHPGEPLICRYYYHEGQVVSRPTCKTERQWIRDRLEVEHNVRALQMRAAIQQN
ncbi:MAG TPA: hypothetical protein VKR31_06105 [Rhizomicrobium sp.]|nr:hypothetical protein [Rhizomicrobium sp.]